MIVFDPPPAPPGMELVSLLPECRAVEIAIRIARIDFLCPETVGSMAWMRLLIDHGPPADFLLFIPSRSPISIEVIGGDGREGPIPAGHRAIRGAQGVLDLAAYLSALAVG